MRHGIYENRILAVLKKEHLISISSIHKKIPEADFSTIFRTVDRLSTRGLVRAVHVNKDMVLYELSDEHNLHDHFLCVDCGNIETIVVTRNNIQTRNVGGIVDVLVRGHCMECIRK